ncbi:uncharacterized protein BXZ73DRAFT_95717 [Epithele typhae]|uniref:uncharacterized protein n=1 Tax=Epithele typhae TaxID=378194 RepID=UPI002007630E|nr:uncharacterized protein BXZ73DRAFT_95717 [Epithele typhae]KAH9946216.1 hypothetical protein BXZ73DRAFT_95717 [Epithele typhae]
MLKESLATVSAPVIPPTVTPTVIAPTPSIRPPAPLLQPSASPHNRTSLPPRPDAGTSSDNRERDRDKDRRPPPPKRRSRSPPTGPRAGPGLPLKPEWGRRGTHQPNKPETKPGTPVPAAAPAPIAASAPEHPVEPGFVPEIPKYQVKSATAEIDAELARLRAHRTHIETEYVTVGKLAQRAMNELNIADLEVKAAELRRATTSSQLEKARLGVLGADFVRP